LDLDLGIGSDVMCGIGLWVELTVGLGARQGWATCNAGKQIDDVHSDLSSQPH
jgi:hypothetical protein